MTNFVNILKLLPVLFSKIILYLISKIFINMLYLYMKIVYSIKEEFRMKKKIISLLAGMCLLATTLIPTNFNAIAAPSPDSGDVEVETETPATDDDDTVITDDIKDACKGKYVNIALVVDTTGSMSWDINAVKENLKAFVNEIKDTGAIPRISLIEYRDINIDEDTIVHYTDSKAAWFESVEIDKLIAEIDALEAFGGGDLPESLVDALGYVVDDDTMLWNADAAKFAIVLTDASYNEYNTWGYSGMDEVITLLTEKNIQTTVITHKDSIDWDTDMSLEEIYTNLVTKTNGTMIDMTDDFGSDLIAYAEKITASTAKVEVDTSYIPVTSIKLGIGEDAIPTDGTYMYTVTVEPSNATVKEILWSVEDEEIAVINNELTKDGYCVLTAKAAGTTTLIARTKDGGYTAYFTITISDIITKNGVSTTAKIEKVSDILSDKSTGITKAVLRTSEEHTVVDGTVLKDIFDLAKLNSKEIEFSFTDETGSELYSWTFDGKDIKDSSKKISTFKIDVDAKSSELAEDAAKDVKDIETDLDGVDKEIAHFENEGELPGKASIKVKTALTDEDELFVYYYNPETKEYELINDGAIVKDGFVTFEIDHCSDYIITKIDLIKFITEKNDTTEEPTTEEPITEEPTTEEPTTVKIDAPETNDATSNTLPVYALLICIAAGAVIYAGKKNLINEK